MTRLFRFTLTASWRVGLALFVAVIGRADTPTSPPELQFVTDQVFKTGFSFKETEVGGLSALVVDPKDSAKIWALSDDRGTVNDPRIYEMKLSFSDEKLPSLSFKDVIKLKSKKGQAFLKGALDPESMVILDNGNFLIGTEGDNDLKPRVSPQIIEFDQKGVMVGEIDLPEEIVPERSGRATRGVRNNAGFEGLALTPSGEVVAALELPLVQDGASTGFTKGTKHRFYRFKREGGSFKSIGQWEYEVDALEQKGETSIAVIQGVTELMALGETEFLVIERGLILDLGKPLAQVKLFRLSTATGKKTECLDLEKIQTRFSDTKNIDNFEALTIVPTPSHGNLLILASDNNFSPTQRTHFLFLKGVGCFSAAQSGTKK